MKHIGMKLGKLHKLQQGVTLVELLVTIAILGILAAIGIPAMARFINDMRVSNAANEFINAHNLARMEAIKRGKLVTICRSTNPDDALPSCTVGSSWATGWLVFVEENENATNTVTSANLLLRHSALSSNVEAEASTSRQITYNSTGEPVGVVAGFGVNFNYSADSSIPPRQLCMSRSGRVKVTQGSTSC